MGTRSLTRVYSDDGKTVLVNMYRQMDGYPEGHGKELAEFLRNIDVVNGLGVEPPGRKIANGNGCLAAQIIAHFKEDPGGIYIFAPNAKDCGQDYEYRVDCADEGEPIFITCYPSGMNGERRKALFRGTPGEYIKWVETLKESA